MAKYPKQMICVLALSTLVGCGPEPGSVADTPVGPPFAILALPAPTDVEAPQEFERRIRREFATFATETHLQFADDSDVYKKIRHRDPLVWLMAYERSISVLVDWNGEAKDSGFPTNYVALIGDYSAERPRQVHGELLRFLQRRGFPFKVTKAPSMPKQVSRSDEK